MDENNDRIADDGETIKKKRAWDPTVDEWDDEEYRKFINKKHGKRTKSTGFNN